MKFFIDTANVDEIREVAAWGVLAGVTTNPSLVAKSGRKFEDVIKEITDIVDGDMIAEGREIAKIHKNMVVKIPMTAEGLKAIAVLSKEGIATNCTLIFTPLQALLAARAGASYVSPFLGRLDDVGTRGVSLIEDIVEIFEIHGIETEIIAASVRNNMHVLECAKAGADIATVPYSVFKSMLNHPLTEAGIEKFIADYEKSIK